METENKYKRGKIYKLQSNQTDVIYYGSTIEDILTNRLSGHRSQYKRWLENKTNYVTSFEIVKYDDCKIILVENYPCNTKSELLARENYYIQNNECINKQIAYTGMSKEEYKKYHYEKNSEIVKLRTKKYYTQHKDEIKDYKAKYQIEHAQELKEKRHKYYTEHQDEFKEKCKIYCETHKEELKQKQKQHRETNSEIITCECGSQTRKYKLGDHLKTKKHQTFLKEQEQEKQ